MSLPTTDTGDTSTSTGTTTETGDEGPLGLVGGPPLVRYFFDEAGNGDRPDSLLDNVAPPFDLAIDYFDGQAAWTTTGAGQRGLEYFAPGTLPGARGTVAETKLATLDGTTEATIEVVLSLCAVTESTSRISHIGSGKSRGDLTLGSTAIDQVVVSLNDEIAREWAYDWLAGGRTVMQAVIDLDEADPVERVQLYANGTLLEPTSSAAADDPPEIIISSGAHFGLGNREGDRSIGGVMHYAAIYDRALTPAQLATNATILDVTDDLPD